MPIGAALAGGAAIGAIAGSQKNVTDQSSTSGLILDPASQQETKARDTMMGAFDQYGNMVNAGPGQSDVSNAYSNNQSLAAMLGQYAKGGYNPTDSDISGANSLFAKLFQPQQTALNQSFDTQNQNFNKQAALMGRDPNDPVFRSKLAYQQSRDQQLLSAQQNSAAQQYAMQQPFQRLNFAQQQNGVLNGLATQAMANRQALASMGQGIMNSERQFRLLSAGKWSDSQQSSGGGLQGALNGAMAGMGTGAKLASGFGSMFPTSTAGGTLGANQGPQLPAWGAGANPAIGPQMPMFAGNNMTNSFMGMFG